MQNHLLDGWQDLIQVSIPPMKTSGFSGNVLEREIWKTQQSAQAQEKPEKCRFEDAENTKEHSPLASSAEMEMQEERTTLLTDSPDLDEEQTTLLSDILGNAEKEKMGCLIRLSTDEEIDLKQESFIIGKGVKADYQVQGNSAISRMHVKITKTEGRYKAEDLGSLNHTFIEEKEITEPTVLEEGMVLKLADEEFLFCIKEG